MSHRLILKVTKFQLPPPKRLGTVVKNILWGAIMPPPPCQIGLKLHINKSRFHCGLSGLSSDSHLYFHQKYASFLFFLHHPTTAQGIKLKLSASKDTPLRHFLQVKPVCYILSCCHGNKITKGTLQNLAPKKTEKSVICKDIELKFGIEAKFGSLSSKSNINLQFDVSMTFSTFSPFH